MFLVRLNDETASRSMRQVAALLKDAFVLPNIAVAFEGETLM